MRVFLTGASGYLGGAVARRLLRDGVEVRGLVRDRAKADAVAAAGMVPVLGDLDDGALLRTEAQAADAVINAASADHRGAATALVAALAGSGKTLLHTSGSGIVSDEARGEPSTRIHDEAEPVLPPPRMAARVAIDRLVLDAQGMRSAVLCNALVYGDAAALPAESELIAALVRQALGSGRARHVGRGLNRWSTVHLDDLAELYATALAAAPGGSFLYVESGEAEMRAVVQAIADRFGQAAAEPADAELAEKAWGHRLGNYTLGANSRVRGHLGRALGWRPRHGSIVDWIRRPGSRLLATR